MTAVLIGLGIGLAAGVLSGLFGIGGGVVIVPALLALGLATREATGTSLAALVLPVGLLAVIEYAKRSEVRVTYAVGIALGLTLGAYVGARTAGKLNNRTIEQLFAVLLAVIAARLFFKR